MSLYLNVGSGQRPFPHPWTNCDVVSREGQVPDVLLDGKTLPFADGSAAVVVLEHCLEHFHLGDADGMIRECHRVLKPGGFFIATVPNLRALAQRWLIREIDDYIFCVNVYGAWQGQPGDDHHWGFSPETLMSTLAKAAEWQRVRPFDWRELAGQRLNKDWWIAGAEAIK